MPDSALKLVGDLCCADVTDQHGKDIRDVERVTQGLGAVWSLILGRPRYRQACLDIALKVTWTGNFVGCGLEFLLPLSLSALNSSLQSKSDLQRSNEFSNIDSLRGCDVEILGLTCLLLGLSFVLLFVYSFFFFFNYFICHLIVVFFFCARKFFVSLL